MIRHKKVKMLALVLTFVMLFATAASAASIPNDSVIIGDKGFSIGFLTNPANAAEIQTALDNLGSGFLAYQIEGLTTGWTSIMSGTPLTAAEVAAFPAIAYKDDAGVETNYPGGGTVTPPDGVAELKIELAANSPADKLEANGAFVMTLMAKVYDKNGILNTAFEGQAEFVSKQRLAAAQQIAAFDQGIAVFNVTLPNSKVDIKDQVYIIIRENADPEYRGIQSSILKLTYKGYDPGAGGEQQNFVYAVESVKSTDLADRANIYVSGIPANNVSAVAAAIIDQVQFHNIDFVAPINVVAVEDILQLKNTNDIVNNYVFTAILEDVSYKAAGYTIAELKVKALYDNQYNFWSVNAPTGNPTVSLKQEALDLDKNKFMLIDKTLPRLEKVEAPRKLANGENDDAWLDVNTLVAYFSEAVNRITAENPNNWVLNGHKLQPADVYGIRVLDLGVCEDAEGKRLLAKKAVSDYVKQDSMGRNVVVIQLKNAAAELYLKNGQNLIQARSIADIAGLTDLSDNNKITTQDFIFPYDKPAVVPSVKIVKESPEQYVITVKGFYADKDATTPYPITTASVKTELLSEINRLLVKDATNDSRIVALPGEPNKHIVELTSDWTKLLVEPVTYHNKFFRVTLTNPAFNRYGVAIDAADICRWAEVEVPEDTVSPAIAVKADGKKDIAYVGSNEDVSGIPLYDKTFGHMIITMDEPVQLYNEAGIDFMAPARTPSTLQDKAGGVPMPSFEYVKVATDVANPLVSVGTKYDGELYNVTAMNEHDFTFGVKPKDVNGANPLDEGHWKLVVRAISDDVGNTMKTEEIPFLLSVPKQSTKVNPYVVWAYADDDKYEDANGNGIYDIGEVINDYVYVLFSREMSIDVLRSATYDINGKQLSQDADITSQSFVAYRDLSQTGFEYFGLANTKTGLINQPEQWKPQLITIKLPADFIVGGDDIDGDRDGRFKRNALTLPLNLTAVDDGDSATVEKLLFTNNIVNGKASNQYELTFEKNFGTLGIADVGDVIGMPAFTYAPNAVIDTVLSHFTGIVPVDPGGAPTFTLVVNNGLTPGKKMVIVTLDTANPENYNVAVAGTPLAYNAAQKKFGGEVDEADAVDAKVVVSEKVVEPTPTFTMAVNNGLVPGKKIVIVTLNTTTPENYNVAVAGTPLTYNASAKKFAGEVDEADAVDAKVVVTAK